MAAQKSLLEHLYCEEGDDDNWGEVEVEDEENCITDNVEKTSLFPLLLLQQDLFPEDEDLHSLFEKERETHPLPHPDPAGLAAPRKRAVDWVLRVNSRHGFSPLTATLAVNYFDRFISSGLSVDVTRRPWTMQLVAVTCLSLAAKVEETHVPLLLDLQVEDALYVFEAKTIQRMELMVLAGLQWRMNPVTPLSFLDHIIRRLGLKAYFHWEFLATCHNLLLSVISDQRLVHYLPSVLATSTMLHVIHQVDPTHASLYEKQLLSVLKIEKGEVDDCYEIISDVMINKTDNIRLSSLKREMGRGQSDDVSSSNHSWASSSSCISSSSSPLLKKVRRTHEQQMRLPPLRRKQVV